MMGCQVVSWELPRRDSESATRSIKVSGSESAGKAATAGRVSAQGFQITRHTWNATCEGSGYAAQGT